MGITADLTPEQRCVLAYGAGLEPTRSLAPRAPPSEETHGPASTTRSPGARFLRATAVTAGAAALAPMLPRTCWPRAPAAAALQVTSPTPTAASAATVLVRDVVDFKLHGDFPWNGGSVTFKLHEGWVGWPAGPLHPHRHVRPGVRGAGGPRVRAAARGRQDQGGRRRAAVPVRGRRRGSAARALHGPGYEDFTPLLHVHGDPHRRCRAAGLRRSGGRGRRGRHGDRGRDRHRRQLPVRRLAGWLPARWTRRSPAPCPAARCCPRRTWTR